MYMYFKIRSSFSRSEGGIHLNIVYIYYLLYMITLLVRSSAPGKSQGPVHVAGFKGQPPLAEGRSCGDCLRTGR